MSRILFAIMSVILIGCGGGAPITDYSNRSVVYTWVDVSEIPGNRLTYFEMRNLSVPKDERFYGMGWEKMGTGFLIWHNGFKPGRYEFSKMQMMSCAGPICTNTINEFDFGRAGSGIGATLVRGNDATFAGCWALKRTKRGFFRPGEFDTRKTQCGVSQRAMLNVLLKSAPPEHPVVGQRIRGAM